MNTPSEDSVYKQATPSCVELLIGKKVSSICFVHNYIEIGFDDLVLTCYTNPTIRKDRDDTNISVPGYRDKLCELIGETVTSVLDEPKQKISVFLGDAKEVAVSLRPEHATSVEAAMLHKPGGVILAVWRYG